MGLIFDYADGQTPIDEDEKAALKIKTVATLGELDEFEQRNIEAALAWVFRSRFLIDKVLEEAFIKNLHKRMFGDVWKWAGTFRKSNKNIGVDWPQIPLELRKLLDDAQYWHTNKTFESDEFILRLKHRLVSIHCFPNGNGRHARVFADLLNERVFNQPPFTWQMQKMNQPSEVRNAYIQSLKKADLGDFNDLIAFARE